jgi:hypothetical protein
MVQALGFTGFSKWMVSTAAHTIVQSSISVLTGGDLGRSILVSFISSATGGLTSDISAAISSNANTQLLLSFGFGGMVGGVTDVIAGGDGWRGAVIGASITAFNHSLHSAEPGNSSTMDECNNCDAGGGNGGGVGAGVGAGLGTALKVGAKALLKRMGKKTLEALPKLDATGKVHGTLPRVKDFAKYSKDELKILLKELRMSVQKRIEVTSRMGRDRGHGQRQGAEQDLIKSLEKYLYK